MTTTDTDIETQTLRLEENIAKLDELNHRLIAVLKTKKKTDPALSGPGHCLLYTSPSPRDVEESRMPSSA